MSLRNTNNNGRTMVLAPAQTGLNQGANSLNLDKGQNGGGQGPFCDVMWAKDLEEGKAVRSFTDHIALNCLNKQPVVKDGVYYPAGSLMYPMQNNRLKIAVDQYPMSPYINTVPLMSHGLNEAALALARAGALENGGSLSIAARNYNKLKSSVTHVMNTMV